MIMVHSATLWEFVNNDTTLQYAALDSQCISLFNDITYLK